MQPSKPKLPRKHLHSPYRHKQELIATRSDKKLDGYDALLEKLEQHFWKEPHPATTFRCCPFVTLQSATLSAII
jgi:hypothetical protein